MSETQGKCTNISNIRNVHKYFELKIVQKKAAIQHWAKIGEKNMQIVEVQNYNQQSKLQILVAAFDFSFE